MPRPLTIAEKAQTVARIEEGWSIRALAQLYGRNQSTVLEVKKRWEQEVPVVLEFPDPKRMSWFWGT